MTTRFPLAPNDATGVATAITAPDTIDPSILPASTSVSFPPTDMIANQAFNVPALSQAVIMIPITGLAGASITGDAGGVLCG